MHTSAARIELFGLSIDALSREAAVTRAVDWITDTTSIRRYVVSPNVDHVVELQRNGKFKRAYENAAMVLPDGMMVVWASRLLRRSLPERVAGPDFVEALLDAAARHGGMKVCILGGAPGVASDAARAIWRRWPALRLVEAITPPAQFSSEHDQNAAVLREVENVGADILVVGLGAPKQEIWVNENLKSLAARLIVCAGGTIDILAGRYPRAPKWIQSLGCEWLFRLFMEPRRLWRRYARDVVRFPVLFLIELLRLIGLFRVHADASVLTSSPRTTMAAKHGAPRIYDYAQIKAVELELTTRCNAACPMCPRNDFGGETSSSLPNAELSLADVRAIFDEDFLAQLERLYLCGTYGDPQMATEALPIIEWIRNTAPSLEIGMATNGGSRDVAWWRQLAKVMGPHNWVTFSIDGLEDTNALYRQGVRWRRVMSHVEAFIHAGGQARWELIVFRHNEAQIAAARALAEAMGFVRFTCKRTYRFHHKDHRIMNPFPVKDRHGHIVRHLEPPLDSVYVNPSLREVGVLTERDRWKEFLDLTPIDCLVRRQRLVHVTAEGLVMPCGWLYDRLYGEYTSSESCAQVRGLLERCGGKPAINAKLRSIEEIVHGRFFSEIAGTWEKDSVAAGRLVRCAVQCGGLAPARGQRVDARDNVFSTAGEVNRQL